MAQALVWMQIATQLLEFINLFTARASPLYTVRWALRGVEIIMLPNQTLCFYSVEMVQLNKATAAPKIVTVTVVLHYFITTTPVQSKREQIKKKSWWMSLLPSRACKGNECNLLLLHHHHDALHLVGIENACKGFGAREERARVCVCVSVCGWGGAGCCICVV